MMRPYLQDLVKRLADQTPAMSSAESVSFAAHREAERLTDITMVDELAEGAHTLKPVQRRGCYFTIGKIGLNLGDERCAEILLGLLPTETDKYNLASLLDGIRRIPKGPRFDLAPVYPLLDDKRWLVRYAAINALDNSANPDSEARVLKHLETTEDPHDMTYCHAVLSTIGTVRALPAIEANLTSRKRDVKASARWAANAIRERSEP
jgi:HEAT repeat protein